VSYIVLSDIHSNLEALTAVLEAVEPLEPEGFLCLGDVVGYGPNPTEVIGLVQAHGMHTVRGNHDQAAIDDAEDAYFNEWATDAIRWTRSQLSEDDCEFLLDLPLEWESDELLLVHASPSAPRAWRYILSAAAAAFEFAAFEKRICFIGHSHVPMIAAKVNGGVRDIRDTDIELAPGMRLIVNVGSVGQPRDGDPRAAYAVLDLDAGTVRIKRVPYEVEETRGKILASGLPRFLGDRLLKGR
jgi:diadenosine tetraphosphatase ApaH/serine/threonine PP2A family protein phosphatase